MKTHLIAAAAAASLLGAGAMAGTAVAQKSPWRWRRLARRRFAQL